jgi:hypothetical protein
VQRHHHEFVGYTGYAPYHQPVPYPPAGFCHSCCHPAAKCCCARECRKEPRELLVLPTFDRGDAGKDPNLAAAIARSAFMPKFKASALDAATHIDGQAQAEPLKFGVGRAFIGGGCCVHLSVEYAPTTPTVTSLVIVFADDSEGTVLGWGKIEQPGSGYRTKECIITTKPGADLTVVVVNATARGRWCEIFSC